MSVRIFVFLSMLLFTACTQKPVRSQEQIVKLNLSKPEPVDLSAYKSIQFSYIKGVDGKGYVTAAPKDLILLLELMKRLEGRMIILDSQIEAYRNFYEAPRKP